MADPVINGVPFSRAAYEGRDADASLPRVRFSRLKALARSPRHYSHELLHDRPDSPGMRLGRASRWTVSSEVRWMRRS